MVYTQDTTQGSGVVERDFIEQGVQEDVGSPFSELALTGIVPETPPTHSQQESERNEEREEEEEERGGSITPSTIVLSPDTPECGVVDTFGDPVATVSLGQSTCKEEKGAVEPDPTDTQKDQQQTATEFGGKLTKSAKTGCVHPETGQEAESISSTGCDGKEKEEPLEDEVIKEAGGSDGQDEDGCEEADTAAAGVEGVEVKEEPIEDEEMEPQNLYVTCNVLESQ